MHSNRHGELSQRKIDGMRALHNAVSKAKKEGKVSSLTRSTVS